MPFAINPLPNAGTDWWSATASLTLSVPQIDSSLHPVRERETVAGAVVLISRFDESPFRPFRPFFLDDLFGGFFAIGFNEGAECGVVVAVVAAAPPSKNWIVRREVKRAVIFRGLHPRYPKTGNRSLLSNHARCVIGV
jgi:hypothetical protein